ncbi:calcium binding EGF domain protein [Trichuris suis]|nr:calcium binding EGF domain protein [Trichuris suis]
MCENNSTCVNTFGSFMCVCVDGWQGEYCDEDIDECKDELSKCHPDFGLCANTLGSYRCECFQKNMDQYCYPRNNYFFSLLSQNYELRLLTFSTSCS